MSQDQTNSNQEKKGQETKLDQINKDLETNKLREDEQGKIEGGFASGAIKDVIEDGNNIWCNEHC